MLIHRVITSLVLISLVGIVFFLVPESIYAICLILFCTIAIYELTNMYKFDLVNQLGLIIIFIFLAGFLCFVNYDASQIIRIGAVILWCFIAPIILLLQPKNFSRPVICVLGMAIFSIAVYAMVILHVLLGAWQLLSIMAIAWIADIGAYFAGRSLGRHKLAPKISPGKSIEGAIAGLFLVIIYLCILKYFNLVDYLYSYVAVLKFALILVSASIVGDLLESWLKRVAGVKDSGSILPGHGGVFDRVDSLVAVLAIAFAMIRGIY